MSDFRVGEPDSLQRGLRFLKAECEPDERCWLGSSSSSGTRTCTMPYTKDIRDYLVRNHISVEVKISSAGGNKRWKCRMCSKEFCSSQSRMVGHLIGGVGISKCKNMSDEAVVAFLRFREARREGQGLDLVALSNERENAALSERLNGGNGFVGEGALVEVRGGGGGSFPAGQEGVAALDEGVVQMLYDTGATPEIVRYMPLLSYHLRMKEGTFVSTLYTVITALLYTSLVPLVLVCPFVLMLCSLC